MRHQALRCRSWTVCLLLLLTLTASTKTQNPFDYLDVVLNKGAWSLRFEGNQIAKFYRCICSSGSVETCSLRISDKTSQIFSVENVNIERNRSMPYTHSAEVYVFDCVPYLSNGYTFPCNRKLATNSMCANSAAVSSGFHHLPPTNGPCKNCSTVCWVGFLYVTYDGGSDILKPAEGKCYESADETLSVSTEDNTIPLDSSQQNAGLNSSGQDSQALGIGVGFSCAVLVVVAIVAVLIFYRRRRFKEKQKAEERRKSYIQPSRTDCDRNDYTCDRGRGSLPPTCAGSSLDCPRNSNNDQPSSELKNIYSSIPDEHFSVSNGDSGMNTQRTPAYKLAKNGAISTKEIKGTNRMENNMNLGLEKYNVAAGTKPIQDRENQHGSNAENKQSCSTQVNEGNFYNVPSEVTESSDSHVYTSLDDAQLPRLETSNIGDRITNTEKSTLGKFNLAPAKDFQPKHVYNRLNDKAKQNDLKTFNKASGNKVENENQESNIYDRVKDPRAKSTPGTYSLAARVRSDQQQQINNKLNKTTETSDRTKYHTSSAEDDRLESFDQRVNDKTKTYDLAGENSQISPYNRLHGGALTPDLDSYNTASEVENGQSSPYNRLNEKADMPDLGTYNKAPGELHKPSLDFSMNKTSTGVAKSRDPYSLATTLKRDQKSSREDVNDYNEVELSRSLDQGQILNGDSTQTLDNENDDSEDTNADYFTLEQE